MVTVGVGMLVHETVIVGSGYGGAWCAHELTRRSPASAPVVMLERGGPVPTFPRQFTTGATITRVARVRDFAPFAQGGGSSVNYGVFATPSHAECARAFGGAHTREALQDFTTLASSMSDTSWPAHPTSRKVQRAFQGSWGLPSVDDATRRGQPRDAAVDNGVVRVGSLVDRVTGTRRDAVTWLDVQRVPFDLVERCDVRAAEELDGNGRDGGARWRVHFRDGRPPLLARTLVLAAGALETPALVLRSRLSRGVNERVGTGLRDHRRIDVVAAVARGATDDRAEGVRFLPLSHVALRSYALNTGPFVVHSEIVPIDSCDMCTERCLRCTGVPSSAVINCLPSWMNLDEGFGVATYDVPCAAPCGLARACNPCYAVSSPGVRVVVGARTGTPGRVEVDAAGERVLTMPTLTPDEAAALHAHGAEVARVLSTTPAVEAPSVTKRTQTDTEWHFVGTTAGCIDTEFRLLDAEGRAYEGLYVADASAAADITNLNTGALAAYAGFLCGRAIAAHEARAPRPAGMERGGA